MSSPYKRYYKIFYKGRWSVRNEPIGEDEYLADFRVIDDVAIVPKQREYVCGDETLLRIRGARVDRFDARGCDFQTVAIYDGEIYLNVAEADDEFTGVWTLRKNKLERVTTGFPPGWESISRVASSASTSSTDNVGRCSRTRRCEHGEARLLHDGR